MRILAFAQVGLSVVGGGGAARIESERERCMYRYVYLSIYLSLYTYIGRERGRERERERYTYM